MSSEWNNTRFWNIERGYLKSPPNHEDFKKDVLTGTTINSFEYENPFSFIPSYGTSVSIRFDSELIQFGDGYSVPEVDALNDVEIQMSLPFHERSNSEIEGIIDHVESNIGKEFPFQTVSYDDLPAGEKYKSLYSIPPYFQQEFRCDGVERAFSRGDYQNVDLVFYNQNISFFSKDYIFAIPSMPTELHKKIKAETKKELFEHIPDQSLAQKVAFRTKRFGSRKSRSFVGKERINDQVLMYDIMFENIDIEKTTLIMAFMMSKGRSWFYFSPDGDPVKQKKFVCSEIEQTYIYNNVFSVRCRIAETISF